MLFLVNLTAVLSKLLLCFSVALFWEPLSWAIIGKPKTIVKLIMCKGIGDPITRGSLHNVAVTHRTEDWRLFFPALWKSEVEYNLCSFFFPWQFCARALAGILDLDYANTTLKSGCKHEGLKIIAALKRKSKATFSRTWCQDIAVEGF